LSIAHHLISARYWISANEKVCCKNRKGVITSAVQNMIIKIVYSYYCEHLVRVEAGRVAVNIH
jgi:REP element-mobilizing transposase RayT